MSFTRKKPWRYPAVDKAVKARGGVTELVRKSGICLTTYYYMQNGRCDPQKFTIDAILDFTGLTYEEAFRK